MRPFLGKKGEGGPRMVERPQISENSRMKNGPFVRAERGRPPKKSWLVLKRPSAVFPLFFSPPKISEGDERKTSESTHDPHHSLFAAVHQNFAGTYSKYFFTLGDRLVVHHTVKLHRI